MGVGYKLKIRFAGVIIPDRFHICEHITHVPDNWITPELHSCIRFLIHIVFN